MRYVIGLVLVAVMFGGAGCPSPDPKPPANDASSPAESPLPLVEQAQRRKPVAQLPKDALDARDQESAALVEIGTNDREAIDARRKADTLDSIRSWIFWIKISAAGLAVVGAGLALWLAKSPKLAASILAIGAGVFVLAWGLGWVLLHMGMVGIIAAVVAGLVVTWKLWEHYDGVRDFATQAAKKISDPEAFREQLADSKVHTAGTFRTLWAKLKG